tara:strand:- start:180 stop:704 length:525 start_codon:yes stop_codon:yes gene_type:complete
MKKIIFFFLFFFQLSYSYSNTNIAYLDVQFIIDNSEIGLFYKKKLKTLQETNNKDLKKKQSIIKDKETDIKNQKNILKDEELKKKISELNELIQKYQLDLKKLNKTFLDQKKQYSESILKILNPLLTSYVDANNITIVIEKKNILVGARSLDITVNMLDILNKEINEKKLINEN